jgi:hypothetical protein
MYMNMKLFAILLFFATLTSAQSIPVVPLSSTDVAKIKQVHQAMLDAERAWADLQKEIERKYLIVDKGDPEAGEGKWYPEDKTGGTLTWTSSSGGIIAAFSAESNCETPEQKKARAAREAQAQKDRERFEQELERKSRRIRRGWEQCPNCVGSGTVRAFDYSQDWKYLVPKPEVTPESNSHQGWSWQTWPPVTLNSN